MEVGDWINLANALGTFAAVAVALVLATKANSREERQLLVRARLAAAQVSARLTATETSVSLCEANAVFMRLDLPESEARFDALVRLKRMLATPLFMPDSELLAALAPLPNSCAHRIARAGDYLARVRAKSESWDEKDLEILSNDERLKNLLAVWAQDLSAASNLLRVALAECVKAAELGAPMPSGEELYGPGDD